MRDLETRSPADLDEVIAGSQTHRPAPERRPAPDRRAPTRPGSTRRVALASVAVGALTASAGYGWLRGSGGADPYGSIPDEVAGDLRAQDGGDVRGPVVAGDDPRTTGAGTGGGTGSASGRSLTPVATSPALTVEHLIRRVTYGPTAGLAERVEQVGVQVWLAEQLAGTGGRDSTSQRIDSWYPLLQKSSKDLRRAAGAGGRGAVRGQFFAAVPQRATARAIWCPGQLHEVLTDFWSNHLNVYKGSPQALSRHEYDAQVIRPHVAGRFRDMLRASAFSTDMIRYLDATHSTKRQPNENYARELLELHTVGVDGGYTEKDVEQSALLLTGLRANANTDFESHFDPRVHHVGPIAVMAFRAANRTAAGGAAEITRYLDHLAAHPATARYLARKLAIRFVSDDPPARLVDRMAGAYLAADTSIAAMLRVCFGSEEFAGSPSTDKLRRPFERVVAAVRVLAPQLPADRARAVEGMAALLRMLDAHLPFAHPTPDGYPDVASAWTSPGVALEQLNGALELAAGRPSGLGLPGAEGLLPAAPTDATALVEAVGRRVLLRAPRAVERDAALAMLARAGWGPRFAPGSAEHRSAISSTCALLLCSPHHLTR